MNHVGGGGLGFFFGCLIFGGARMSFGIVNKKLLNIYIRVRVLVRVRFSVRVDSSKRKPFPSVSILDTNPSNSSHLGSEM